MKVVPSTNVVPKNIDGLPSEAGKKVEHKRFRLGHVEVSPNPGMKRGDDAETIEPRNHR